MGRKNPENKPLRITYSKSSTEVNNQNDATFPLVLAQLAVAQSNLVKAGKDSAMPHFIAIVKELERCYGFKFEICEDIKEE